MAVNDQRDNMFSGSTERFSIPEIITKNNDTPAIAESTSGLITSVAGLVKQQDEVQKLNQYSLVQNKYLTAKQNYRLAMEDSNNDPVKMMDAYDKFAGVANNISSSYELSDKYRQMLRNSIENDMYYISGTNNRIKTEYNRNEYLSLINSTVPVTLNSTQADQKDLAKSLIEAREVYGVNELDAITMYGRALADSSLIQLQNNPYTSPVEIKEMENFVVSILSESSMYDSSRVKGDIRASFSKLFDDSVKLHTNLIQTDIYSGSINTYKELDDKVNTLSLQGTVDTFTRGALTRALTQQKETEYNSKLNTILLSPSTTVEDINNLTEQYAQFISTDKGKATAGAFVDKESIQTINNFISSPNRSSERINEFKNTLYSINSYTDNQKEAILERFLYDGKSGSGGGGVDKDLSQTWNIVKFNMDNGKFGLPPEEFSKVVIQLKDSGKVFSTDDLERIEVYTEMYKLSNKLDKGVLSSFEEFYSNVTSNNPNFITSEDNIKPYYNNGIENHIKMVLAEGGQNPVGALNHALNISDKTGVESKVLGDELSSLLSFNGNPDVFNKQVGLLNELHSRNPKKFIETLGDNKDYYYALTAHKLADGGNISENSIQKIKGLFDSPESLKNVKKDTSNGAVFTRKYKGNLLSFEATEHKEMYNTLLATGVSHRKAMDIINEEVKLYKPTPYIDMTGSTEHINVRNLEIVREFVQGNDGYLSFFSRDAGWNNLYKQDSSGNKTIKEGFAGVFTTEEWETYGNLLNSPSFLISKELTNLTYDSRTGSVFIGTKEAPYFFDTKLTVSELSKLGEILERNKAIYNNPTNRQTKKNIKELSPIPSVIDVAGNVVRGAYKVIRNTSDSINQNINDETLKEFGQSFN